MGDKTKIEWTDASWNPVTGCTKVSPGCDHCYAETITERFHGPGSFAEIKLIPERLDQPLRWRRPRRVFVNSMSDLFHEKIPTSYIARVFAVMCRSPQHTFQVLTKRPGPMRSLMRSESFQQRVLDLVLDADIDANWDWPLPNVWLGVSAEDQKWADVRIPVLLSTPAAVRFVSAEPLLGPMDLQQYLFGGLDWLIVGGESGRGARPMDPEWVRNLRDQCAEAPTAFFFKQTGSGDGGPKSRRMLDGRTWDEYPQTQVTA